jgi:hypothetical protein
MTKIGLIKWPLRLWNRPEGTFPKIHIIILKSEYVGSR